MECKVEKSLALTPLGEKQASSITNRGRSSSVVAALQEHGPSTVKEVSKITGISRHDIKKIAKELHKEGYVRVIQGTEDP